MMKKANFTAPGYYRIEVQGHLRPDLSEHFGSMRVVPSSLEEKAEISVLQGRVSDQAELAGILNTLYEFHLPLLAVEYLDDESP